jgi:hypothetical protein
MQLLGRSALRALSRERMGAGRGEDLAEERLAIGDGDGDSLIEAFSKGLVREALRMSVGRREVVAARAGVSVKTLEHWIDEHNPDRKPPASFLLLLLTPAPIELGGLDDRARGWLLERVMDLAGVIAAVAPEPCPRREVAHEAVMVMRITGELGELSMALSVSTGACSAGGERITADERRRLVCECDDIERRVLQLRAVLVAKAGVGRE